MDANLRTQTLILALGADIAHNRVEAKHDKRAGVAAHDPLQAIAERGTRRDNRERSTSALVSPDAHRKHLP